MLNIAQKELLKFLKNREDGAVCIHLQESGVEYCLNRMLTKLGDLGLGIFRSSLWALIENGYLHLRIDKTGISELNHVTLSLKKLPPVAVVKDISQSLLTTKAKYNF